MLLVVVPIDRGQVVRDALLVRPAPAPVPRPLALAARVGGCVVVVVVCSGLAAGFLLETAAAVVTV